MQRSVSHTKPEGCGAKRCFLPFLCIAKRVAGHGVDSNQKDSVGNLKFIGTYRGFFEVSTVMHFEERKRFPQELFLPGFPTRDNLTPGTEDSQPPTHHSEPRPDGGVLISQLPPPEYLFDTPCIAPLRMV